MSPEQPTSARICPACGRRVPRRIEECRCGFTLGAEAELSIEPPPPARSAAPVWVAAAVVVLGLAAFVLWPRARQAEVSAQAPPAAAVAVEASAAEPPPGAEAPEWPSNVAYLTPPARDAERPPAPSIALRPAPDRPRTLEAAVAAALPAVALIETPGARGTGFLVAADTAITNAHVVEGNAYVTLQFASGETISARVTATAPEYDLAVLRLSSARTGVQPLTLGDVARVRVGQEVLAIGSPLGLRNTVTRGIVSALRRVGPAVLVQTDAAINPGNSGGPIVDAGGRVIGIATMKVAGGAESLGFAVAADHARALLDTGSPALRPGSQPPPQAASSDVLPPPSDSLETARANGAVQFERVMAQAARRADSLDDYWKQFSKVCLARPARTGGDRPWFAIWEREFPTDAVAPACVADFKSFSTAAGTLRGAVTEADEAARQAGVYPGSRRELLARYRLAWDGWER